MHRRHGDVERVDSSLGGNTAGVNELGRQERGLSRQVEDGQIAESFCSTCGRRAITSRRFIQHEL